jgi:hypothetical protein
MIKDLQLLIDQLGNKMPKDYPLDCIAQAGSQSCYCTGVQMYLPVLFQKFLSANGKKRMYSIYNSGILTKSIDDITKYLEDQGGTLTIYREGSYTYYWEDGFIDLTYRKDAAEISTQGVGLDVKFEKIDKYIDDNFITQAKTNLIFTIIKGNYGLEIKNMGNGSSPLISENYLPEVLEEVDFVIKSFKKDPPVGRIAIFNGDPGTGKTHLIRSMLSQLDCVWLIVPSNLISSLDKPEFLPLLMRVKDNHEKPIIMIIEDGDICLVPRKSDNISTIASLLNLSDGILGTIIDVKMIISTNAEIREIDQAILRPGRLCRNIYVGPLTYDHANKVYRRLMKDEAAKLPDKRDYTLAEIYDKVNNTDTQLAPSTIGKRPIGFGNTTAPNDRTMNRGKIGFGT